MVLCIAASSSANCSMIMQPAVQRARSFGSAASTFAAPRTLAHRSSSSSQSAGRQALQVRAGNHATNGPFAPLVIVVRNTMGTKQFNQLRGKAISLHSQVIKDFCKQLGADGKQVQGLIRLAKKNGEKLGFLA